MLRPELKLELRRKLFHSLSLLYLGGYLFLGRDALVWILGAALALESAVEFVRLYNPAFNAWLIALFGGIHRERETRKASGIFWTLLGCFLIIWTFPDRKVVACALGYIVFADSAAALVGTQWGRHKIGNKSIEGTVAFFCAALAVGLFWLKFPQSIMGAVFATLVEIIPLPFNDNFWIPVLSALFLSAIPS